MPFLRLSILFAFFAFSYAMADCDDDDDFEIFAKINDGEPVSLGCDDDISTEITYGDALILSVKPADTTYEWRVSNTEIKTGSSFSPKFSVSENPSPSITETYIVKNKNDLRKTIEVTINGRPTYTVSFDTDEDDEMTTIDEQEVMKDSLAKEPKETLTKTGYNFGGWDFDFKTTPITKDTTIKAIWKIKAYLVFFDTDGGMPSILPQMVIENDLAKEPKETLTKTGYDFDGWNFDFKTHITKDTSIKAIWKVSPLFVGDTIEFDTTGFYLDTIFSSEHRHYFVASPKLCEIKNTKIHITIKEPNKVLIIDGEPQRSTDEKGLRYEIPFVFGKPGLDTLIYEWISKDSLYSRFDTILIETPIPFKEPFVKQKWNSVLFVNNNPKTNGGYEIIDFEWFKNNELIGNLQFYSVTSTNPSYVYKIVMQTAEGIRISTCEGNAGVKVLDQTPKKRPVTKQVLGIKEKSLNKDSKVYNLNGKLTKETPAGVYIVEE
jgi:hypothetical protein